MLAFAAAVMLAVHVSGDSLRARQLLRAASDRDAMLDERGYATLIEQAFRADPGYFPAQRAMLVVERGRLPIREVRAAFAHVPGLSAADSACLVIEAGYVSGRQTRTVRALHAAERRLGKSTCLEYVVATLASADRMQTRVQLEREWRPVLASRPTDALVLLEYAKALQTIGDPAAAERAMERASASAADWESYLLIQQTIIASRTARGDSAGARRVRDALSRSTARDGRPGVRFVFESAICCWRAPAGDGWMAVAELAGSHAARGHLAKLYEALGAGETDAGRPAVAVRFLRSAAALADSLGWRPLREAIYVRLGRAYAKSGDWTHAVPALRKALAIADPDETYYLADIHHNLAHAYEAAGRMPEAAAEVDRFASLAGTLTGDGISVISLYDAGVIRWEARRHSAAIAAFDSMVHVIEQRHANYYYAGEYYERMGDPARALHYYRAVTWSDTEEGARALTGLARVYESLGMRDSAAAVAQRHDVDVQTPEEVRLQPRILVSQGRTAEGLSLARAWADSQVRRGNARGAALAELEVARLMENVATPAEQLAWARRAERSAKRTSFTDGVVRAQAFAADAMVRLDSARSAIDIADSASGEAAASGAAESRFVAAVARGDVLGAARRVDAALAAYDTAGRLVDSMADSFDGDLERSRMRAYQLAPFDRAVALLLREPMDRHRLQSLVFWSQRRNAAALPPLRGQVEGALPVGTIPARLGRGRAVVAYVLLDSAAAAIVITHSGANVVALPTTAGDIARLVAAVRRPWTTSYVERVDLARANVDTTAPRELSRALIAPLMPFLSGIQTLAVVPDGALHLAPFDLLPTARGIMIDQFAVSLAPTMRFAAMGTSAHLDRASLLLVGGDAPGATAEVDALERLWSHGRTHAVWTSSTTAASIRDAMQHYEILHFATHAVVDQREPLASRLVLREAHDEVPAMILSVADIERVRLHGQLVVLDACDTQDGQLLPGVGPTGLARTFLVSGARAVIATQWPVGASAAPFMAAFYARLAAGEPAEEALRSAKQEMRAHAATRNPFNWAGFVLVRGG